MSLSTKQLQARSRAFYAPKSMSHVYSLELRHHLANRMRAIHTPICPLPGLSVIRAASRPMSPLARDLFNLLGSSHSAFGSYDSIACSPGIGRNLSAQA